MESHPKNETEKFIIKRIATLKVNKLSIEFDMRISIFKMNLSSGSYSQRIID